VDELIALSLPPNACVRTDWYTERSMTTSMGYLLPLKSYDKE
jgi:hypothetical protein